MDPKQLDRETRDYFYSLPPMVQEDLMQSSLQFSSKAELQHFAEQLLKRGR
ncbi:MAG: hypothetical protein PUC59_09490 [Firmicutes bacterium]|nr:hypothetical protein [Bacillota bacterium]